LGLVDADEVGVPVSYNSAMSFTLFSSIGGRLSAPAAITFSGIVTYNADEQMIDYFYVEFEAMLEDEVMYIFEEETEGLVLEGEVLADNLIDRLIQVDEEAKSPSGSPLLTPHMAESTNNLLVDLPNV
ncbi:hypothetical protein Tco_1479317, partial [Tanacetum coccineum]